MTAPRRSTAYCVQIFAAGVYVRTLSEALSEVAATAFVTTYNRWQLRTRRHAVAVPMEMTVRGGVDEGEEGREH